MGMTTLSACMNIFPMLAPTVDAEKNIKADFNFKSNYVEVLGSKMHYVEEGQGETIVLLHGNPTSSYLWRNIIPTLAKTHRVIAPDLIGMGKSDKPELDYMFQDHSKYFKAFLKAVDVKNVTLVFHDWGGAIGLDYYRGAPDNVKRLVIMEAVIRPIYWKDADFVTTMIFKKLRDEKEGHQLIVEENYFVEKLLPMMSGRKLSEQEMNYYRAPY